MQAIELPRDDLAGDILTPIVHEAVADGAHAEDHLDDPASFKLVFSDATTAKRYRERFRHILHPHSRKDAPTAE